MGNDDDLARLAERAGIEPDFWDIFGNHHEVTRETQRAILFAMGIASEDESVIRENLRAFDEAPWREAGPPVLVVREGSTLRVPLVLAAAAHEEALEWILVEERNARHTGQVTVSEIPLLDSRELDGVVLERRLFELPVNLPLGYHRLRLPGVAGGIEVLLILVPRRCYLPPESSEEGREWGIATQLYALRSETNWGIGDLTDLGDLLEKAARLGASTVGVNPLHALSPLYPEQACPYMPSSQMQLNPLYLDVVVIPDLAESAEAQKLLSSDGFRSRLERVRSVDLVDYPKVAALKGEVFELLYRSFRDTQLANETERAVRFLQFKRQGGEALRRFAIFQALAEHFESQRWMEWPAAYREPGSQAVEQFSEENQERIEFFEYLQWQADDQLAMAQRRAQIAGASYGLYRDLAVGVAPDGPDAWARQDVIVQRGRLGAPPDPFNPLGQAWGSAPLHPHALRKTGYRRFIEVLRSNMRHAGALRIDHVMGLSRIYWIPEGAFASSGAYVGYPQEDLIGILALESQRHRCLIVGEDLGTVPEGFRERMEEAGILSYRVLWFEQNGAGFKSPAEYPVHAVACATTHDLPTIRGFFEQNDLALRRQHDLYPTTEIRIRDEDGRARDLQRLLEALDTERLLPEGLNPNDPPPGPDLLAPLIEALHLFLARSNARLFMVQLDDLLAEANQMNLPGTVFEYPNWQRRVSRDLEFLVADEAVTRLADSMNKACPAA